MPLNNKQTNTFPLFLIYTYSLMFKTDSLSCYYDRYYKNQVTLSMRNMDLLQFV